MNKKYKLKREIFEQIFDCLSIDINTSEEREFIVQSGSYTSRRLDCEIKYLVSDKPKEVKKLARELINTGDTDNLIMAEAIL